ncbi:serine O-acetyltransferase [Hymenobacter cellulosilyticus]|uniref:Serine O-acetyltransferase n=1 Tax=Hymenobacter cellulosilyticus TaxID=2932248 RepID=A0A8T9QB53_9BACT|nr:serine O-acetyltransferase [Hymenobacter cellulosilyticus]UOQ74405.1 serine O-acetyltransferase [Hymenobacter cellulosilyticus]
MHAAFIQSLAAAHRQATAPLPGQALCLLADQLLQVLFPERATRPLNSTDAVEAVLYQLQTDLADLLRSVLSTAEAEQIAQTCMQGLPQLRDLLLGDAEAIVAADPAAKGSEEVISTYPGFYAIALHRFAHALYQLQVPRVPRLLSEYAHTRTGVDIHPGARIGPSFCIDHGTGIVIGETAVIGAYVKIFQGVTLGALSVAKHMANIKRHPTIEDHTVVYAGLPFWAAARWSAATASLAATCG